MRIILNPFSSKEFIYTLYSRSVQCIILLLLSHYEYIKMRIIFVYYFSKFEYGKILSKTAQLHYYLWCHLCIRVQTSKCKPIIYGSYVIMIFYIISTLFIYCENFFYLAYKLVSVLRFSSYFIYFFSIIKYSNYSILIRCGKLNFVME